MANTLFFKLLAIILSLRVPTAPGYTPEPIYEQNTRLLYIAGAIAAHARTPEEAAFAYVLSKNESQFDRLVHAGLVHPVWTQDKGRAKCLGQIHKTGLVPNWHELAGVDYEATERCVKAIIKIERSVAGMCIHTSLLTQSDAERVFAAYAGRGCTPTRQSVHRAKEWSEVVRRLR